MGGSNVEVLKSMIEKKFLGKKSGKGIYNYDKAGKDKHINDEAATILNKYQLERKGWSVDSLTHN